VVLFQKKTSGKNMRDNEEKCKCLIAWGCTRMKESMDHEVENSLRYNYMTKMEIIFLEWQYHQMKW